MIRTAIVGAGLMGRWHADAAVRSGGRVVAVVDLRPERARALAAATGVAPAASSLAEVDLAEVDVVHVCTPTPTHAELARSILMAGCPALVEKPLAADAAETEGLLKLAEERGRLLCPVHQYVFQHGVARVAGGLDRLGTIRHVEVTICSAGAEGLAGEGRDGIAGEILSHPLSLLARLFDWPLEDLPWHVMRPAAGEIRAVACAGGGTIEIFVSMSARPARSTLAILGEAGSAHADLFHGYAFFERGGASRGRKLARPFSLAGRTLLMGGSNLARRAARREPAFPGLRELVGRCYTAVRGSALPGPIPPGETLAVARARDTILRPPG
ncbi:MAG TPA: Gfo/Idh/MocA family oxidoreductase [Gemmatimonadota bacterium]|nr:Gfo/Idh/MocA family oxidoreductase [Gemmatimonadota bacterium]